MRIKISIIHILAIIAILLSLSALVLFYLYMSVARLDVLGF